MKISIQGITKAYGGRDLFREFSLEVNSGVRLCVVGSNGTGKSTMLRILAGESEPDSGKVVYPKGARVGYVAQDFGREDLERSLVGWVMDVLPSWHSFWDEWEAATAAGDTATLAELGRRQAELEQTYGYNPEHRAHAVLSGLGFAEPVHGQAIKTFSGGWRERAKLARVLVQGADVLLLDEPTNHLDLEAIEWLEQFLLDYQGVLVLVAHDRVFMERLGTHLLYLGLSKPMYRPGTFAQFLEWQAETEMQREREAKRLQTEIDKKMAFVTRFKYKATKARQAGSKQKQARKLEKELEGYASEQKQKTLAFKWPEPARAEKTICSVVDLEFSFSGKKSMWSRLNWNLFRGQKVALCGPNGCGKSTLLKLIVKELTPSHGYTEMGTTVKMGYFSQHQVEILDLERTVVAEIRRLSDPRTTEEELRSVLGLFLLGQEYFDRPVKELSGGEKSRLVLATLFLRRSNFLVLDEPTNHLDLESREALIQALEDYTGTILMVAHDRWLLSRVAEQVWALGPGGLEVCLDGFEEYDRNRRAQLSEDAAARRKPSEDREVSKQRKREQAELRNTLYKEIKPKKAEYEKIEQELEALLERVGELERTMALPETYADAARMNAMLKEYAEGKARSEALFERMAELEAELADLEAQRAELAG
ncbi:MAG: ATP-binding cassette domain-containing protein [Desulfovibrionaceae bacterium]